MWRVDGDDSAGLFAHVLPQAVLARPRADRPHARRHASAGGGSGANELYDEGPHARQLRRGAPEAERARRVNGE